MAFGNLFLWLSAIPLKRIDNKILISSALIQYPFSRYLNTLYKQRPHYGIAW